METGKMVVGLAVENLLEHWDHAHVAHPGSIGVASWEELLSARVRDLFHALHAKHVDDHLLIAGKRAMQVSVMALRIVEDLYLGLVPPFYDASPLPHVPAPDHGA